MTLIKAVGLAVFTASLALPALAADEYNTSSGITAAGTPLGFHGVDPVARLKGTLTQGVASHTAVYEDVSYYFATAEDAAVFKADPAAHLPQFGGFCTFAVGLGKKFDGDPRYADVRNGKLYVFVNEAVFQTYLEDPEGTIAKAEAKWPQIRSIPALEL
ncbi:MAG: YHS domain-containing (seleno)protein [Pseudomonadota bacterium]